MEDVLGEIPRLILLHKIFCKVKNQLKLNEFQLMFLIYLAETTNSTIGKMINFSEFDFSVFEMKLTRVGFFTRLSNLSKKGYLMKNRQYYSLTEKGLHVYQKYVRIYESKISLAWTSN